MIGANHVSTPLAVVVAIGAPLSRLPLGGTGCSVAAAHVVGFEVGIAQQAVFVAQFVEAAEYLRSEASAARLRALKTVFKLLAPKKIFIHTYRTPFPGTPVVGVVPLVGFRHD